jgi:hypothetical protein
MEAVLEKPISSLENSSSSAAEPVAPLLGGVLDSGTHQLQHDLSTLFAPIEVGRDSQLAIDTGPSKVNVKATSTELPLTEAVSELKTAVAVDLYATVSLTDDEGMAQLQELATQLKAFKNNLGKLASDITELSDKKDNLSSQELTSSNACRALGLEVESLVETTLKLGGMKDELSKTFDEISGVASQKGIGVDSLKQAVSSAFGKVGGFFSSIAESFMGVTEQISGHKESFLSTEAWASNMQEVKDNLVSGLNNSGADRFSFSGLRRTGEFTTEIASGAYQTLAERLAGFLTERDYFGKMSAHTKEIESGLGKATDIDKDIKEAQGVLEKSLIGRVFAGEWKFAIPYYGNRKLKAIIEQLTLEKGEAETSTTQKQQEQAVFQKNTVSEMKTQFAGSRFSTTDFAEGDPRLELLKQIAIPTSRIETMISYGALVKGATALNIDAIKIAPLAEVHGFSVTRGEGADAMTVRIEKASDTRVRVYYMEEGQEKSGLSYHDEALKIIEKIASGGSVRFEKKKHTDYTIPVS